MTVISGGVGEGIFISVTDLILNISVTQFQTQNVLKCFTQHLVGVEVFTFYMSRQYSNDEVMDTSYSQLRDAPISVTCRLKYAQQSKEN